MTAAGSISSCRERPTAAWPNEPWPRRRAACALPDELDDVTAAAIANPGMSSWAAYAERAKLKAGETVLVNGATGTAGRLAVQIAKHLGAGKVIATARNADALKSVAALGADVTIPLVDDEAALEESFRQEFAQGVDVVIDYLWGKSAERLLIAGGQGRKGGGPDPVRPDRRGQRAGHHPAERRVALLGDRADGKRHRQHSLRSLRPRHRRAAPGGRAGGLQDRDQSGSAVGCRTGMAARRQRPAHRVHDRSAMIACRSRRLVRSQTCGVTSAAV